jgi:hypothetical protein
MLPKENVVVSRQSFPFGKLSLDPQEGPVHVLDGNRINLFDERIAALAINEGEEVSRPALARDDEVSLHISNPTSFGYARRSLVNEGPIGKPRAFRLSQAEALLSEGFNRASVDAFDESANRILGSVRKIFRTLFQSARNGFGRLTLQKVSFHEVSELGFRNDLHPLELGVLSPDVCFGFGLLRIVASFDSVAFQFVGEGGNAAVHALANLSKGVAFLPEDEELFPFGGGEVSEDGFLFFIVFSKKVHAFILCLFGFKCEGAIISS